MSLENAKSHSYEIIALLSRIFWIFSQANSNCCSKIYLRDLDKQKNLDEKTGEREAKGVIDKPQPHHTDTHRNLKNNSKQARQANLLNWSKSYFCYCYSASFSAHLISCCFFSFFDAAFTSAVLLHHLLHLLAPSRSSRSAHWNDPDGCLWAHFSSCLGQRLLSFVLDAAATTTTAAAEASSANLQPPRTAQHHWFIQNLLNYKNRMNKFGVEQHWWWWRPLRAMRRKIYSFT